MNNFLIDVNLSSLNETMTTTMEVNGIEERGIFIPFRYNFLNTYKNNVLLRMVAFEKKANAWNQSHGVREYGSKRMVDKLGRLGIKTKFIGNMKLYYDPNFNYRAYKKNSVDIDDALDK